ncbi:MAG: hypothetical protein Q9169_008764, partial [Polycauliona sp. 2 TL-2023]
MGDSAWGWYQYKEPKDDYVIVQANNYKPLDANATFKVPESDSEKKGVGQPVKQRKPHPHGFRDHDTDMPDAPGPSTRPIPKATKAAEQPLKRAPIREKATLKNLAIVQEDRIADKW